MSWGEKAIERALTPGFILVVLGMVIVLCSSILAKGVSETRRPAVSLMFKAAGVVVTLIGAVLVFMQ